MKKTNTRKIFAIIMAVIMCFSMVSITAFATDTQYLASVTTADGTTTNYTNWKEASNAAAANPGSTLKMLTDYTFDNSDAVYNFKNGKFTFDLNGFTVEPSIIIDNATITIIDSAEEKGTIMNSGNVAIEYYGGTLIFDESADFFGEYADHDPWYIYNCSGEEMIIGEDIVVPDDARFMDCDESVVIDTLPADTLFYMVDASTLSDYYLWVGGVAVNADNADDIFGDGTASYNAEENILTLNGANITEGYNPEDYVTIGIYAENDLNIELAEGTENNIAIPGNEYTYGICVLGSLYITGEGVLNITNGDYISEGIYESHNNAIFTANGLCVEQANVIAQSGDATAGYYADAAGVWSYGDVSVDFGGALLALAGDATGYQAYSNGIVAYGGEDSYLNVSVYDGYLEAYGGKATGGTYAMTTGLYLYNAGFYVYENTANVFIEADDAAIASTDEEELLSANSVGVFTYGGDVGIDAGNVTISSGECTAPDTYSGGIYASYIEYEDGSRSGGNVNINCYDITPYEDRPGFYATNVNISTIGGIAILAEMGIEIGENLVISSPENAVVEEDGEYLVCVDGEPAESLTIEVLTYEVAINGLRYDMAADVPANYSLNELYCEIHEVDDFSELLNTEKEGYTFGGFYTDEACTEGNEFDFDTPITEDITIYAKWIEVIDDNEQGGNEQGGNEQGGNASDENNNQNTPDNEDNKNPVPDPEIPNTDVNTTSYVWLAMALLSTITLVAYATLGKKKFATK